MIETTEQQARALAFLLHEIRPDWGVPSLLTLLGNNRRVPSVGALVLAATTKAMEPTCKTPAPIFHPGPHWPDEVREQLPKGPPCGDHPEFDARNCRCCLADVKVGQRDPADVGKQLHTAGDKHSRYQELLAQARGEEAEAVPSGAASNIEGANQ